MKIQAFWKFITRSRGYFSRQNEVSQLSSPAALEENVTTRPVGGKSVRQIPIFPSGSEFSCPTPCWGSCCKAGLTLDAYDAGNIVAFAERNEKRFVSHFTDKEQVVQTNQGEFRGEKVIRYMGKQISFGFFRQITTDIRGVPLKRSLIHTATLFDPDTKQPKSCIFLTGSKSCFLEEVAIEIGVHRWYAKPIACIAFPLQRDASGSWQPLNMGLAGEAGPESLALRVRAYQDKACFQEVTNSNFASTMKSALAFIREHDPKRKERFQRYLAQKRGERAVARR